MSNLFPMRAGAIAALVAVLAVAGCGLPRSGPYVEDLRSGAEGEDPGYDLINVTPEVASLSNKDETLGFELSLTEAQPERTAILGVGDALQITIWERGDNALFGTLGGATVLQAEIEESGNIYIPYVGNVRATGRTQDGLRKTIRKLLEDKTLDPQVEVRRETGDSKSITISGSAGVAGVVPIERTTRSLLSLLAASGVTVEDPDVVRVRVRRGPMEGEIWLRDLYENPEYDIPVRAGDVIFLDLDDRYFRSLGAVGQARVPFPTRDISVLDALALIGGLNGAISDPSGVFLFREEPAEIAVQISETARADQPRKIGYLIDLSKGEGLFIADSMKMRDGDLIYVTDAPFVRFQTVAGAVASSIGFAGSVGSVRTGFGFGGGGN